MCCIAMSFLTVSTVSAKTADSNKNQKSENTDPGKSDPVEPITYYMNGTVILTAYRTIILAPNIYFKTPITFPKPIVGRYVRINYWVNPDGVRVAISWVYLD